MIIQLYVKQQHIFWLMYDVYNICNNYIRFCEITIDMLKEVKETKNCAFAVLKLQNTQGIYLQLLL